jgi:hypothetical protein
MRNLVQMKHHLIITLLFLGFLFSNLFINANGGPIDGAAVKSTGKIVFLKNYNISLVREELNITLDGDYSIIEVTYYLANKEKYSDSVLVDFGFPVDYSFNMTAWSSDGDAIPWDDTYVPYFFAYSNEKQLNIQEHFDISVMNDSAKNNLTSVREGRVNSYKENIWDIDYKRKWYITQLSFLKNEEKKLVIKYKVKNAFCDWATSKSYYPIYDARSLFYDLCPAQYWDKSNSVILDIKIDAKQNFLSSDSVFIYGINGFNLKDSIYEYHNIKFDFTKSEPLQILFYLDHYKLSSLILEKSGYHSIRSIKSSQSSANNKNGVAADSNLFTSLCVTKPENFWIEMNFNNFKASSICMLNGNFENEEAYYNSARLKKVLLQISFEDSVYSDVSFKTKILVDTICFKDMAYTSFNKYNFSKYVLRMWDKSWYLSDMEKVKITVLEIYPGKKNNYIYIPEIFFLGTLF